MKINTIFTKKRKPKILAIIPAFKEEKNIAVVISKLIKTGYDVIVVDDGSPDKTKEIALKEGAIVIKHCINMGYGVSLQTGYIYANEKGYDYVIQLDADGQHDPKDTTSILAPILNNEADLVIGSRFLGNSYKVPFTRKMGIKFFDFIMFLCTGNKFTDCTSGYQAMNSKVVKLFCTESFPPDFPDADVLILLYRLGFHMKEVPTSMKSSVEGKSMHSGVLKPLWYIVKLLLSIMIVILRKRRQL
ncbi:MAG: glycosyltransferase family 2 protein [Candidatus Firestonebacteria bacterium]